MFKFKAAILALKAAILALQKGMPVAFMGSVTKMLGRETNLGYWSVVVLFFVIIYTLALVWRIAKNKDGLQLKVKVILIILTLFISFLVCTGFLKCTGSLMKESSEGEMDKKESSESEMEKKESSESEMDKKTVYVCGLSKIYHIESSCPACKTEVWTLAEDEAINMGKILCGQCEARKARVDKAMVAMARQRQTERIQQALEEKRQRRRATEKNSKEKQSTAATTYRISDTIVGHEYVDLGLSVKWATMNVGASCRFLI